MGKQSRRDRQRTPRAPRTLSASTHPHFESEFRAIELSTDLLADGCIQAMSKMVDDGFLVEWKLGRKGTHISSKFVSAGGSEDTLSSPDPNDDDYPSLVRAHIQSVFRTVRQEMGEEWWTEMVGRRG